MLIWGRLISRHKGNDRREIRSSTIAHNGDTRGIALLSLFREAFQNRQSRLQAFREDK
jgi:hypothetical protein